MLHTTSDGALAWLPLKSCHEVLYGDRVLLNSNAFGSASVSHRVLWACTGDHDGHKHLKNLENLMQKTYFESLKKF